MNQNNKILIIFGVLIVIGIGAFCLYQKSSTEEYPDIFIQPGYKNISYQIEGQQVTLKNGVVETEIVPGSASKSVTTYFGNEVFADFNEDGLQDVAFLLTQNNGGSGTFYYVVAAIKTADGHLGTNAILLGDRIAPQTTEFSNGEIIVNYADRKAGEAMTIQPSLGISRYFKVGEDELVEVLK
jgi:hypothetical protein